MFYGVLLGCVGVFCGVLFGGLGGLVFVLLFSIVMVIFVFFLWVGRGGNLGGGCENVLDGFGLVLIGLFLGVFCDVFLSIVLYDIEVVVLFFGFVFIEVCEFMDLIGGGED